MWTIAAYGGGLTARRLAWFEGWWPPGAKPTFTNEPDELSQKLQP